MQVRHGNLFAIRVPVWGASKVEPNKDYNLPPAVLHLDLHQVDTTAAQVKQKLLAAIDGLERYATDWPPMGEVAPIFIYAMLLHSNRVCLTWVRSDMTISHSP